MIYNLLYFIIISFFCILWGMPVVLMNSKEQRHTELPGNTFFFSFFIGLTLLSVLASWIGLFMPVRFSVLIFASIIWVLATRSYLRNVLLLLKKPAFKKLTIAETLFLASCVLLFFYLSTEKPTMEDAELYHIQSIKWAHEFGVVPGLANLYLRFGFYSNWFHAISLFDLPALNKNFVFLNFTFVVWFFFFLFHQYKINTSQNKLPQQQVSLFILFSIFFMIIEWDLFRVASSSTSYDFVITAMTLTCLILSLKKITGDHKEDNEFILLVLVLTAPFYKLTGFFLAPFWFLLLYYSQKRRKLVYRSIIIFLISFLPFAVKNYVQTGYIFFPYKILDLWHPDWQIPGGMLTLLNKYIYLSNHYINQSIPGFPLTNGSSFSFFRDWFLHLVRADQIIIVCGLVLFPLAWIPLKRIYNQQYKTILLLYGLCLLAVLAWLFASPDPRFAFGFLVFMVFFPLSAMVVSFKKNWMIDSAFLLMSVAILTYVSTKGSKDFKPINLIQPSAADVPDYKTIQINNQKYNIPSIINNNWNKRCINTPLPCIYDYNSYLRTRGKEIKNGFKMSPYPDSSFILNYYY